MMVSHVFGHAAIGGVRWFVRQPRTRWRGSEQGWCGGYLSQFDATVSVPELLTVT